MTTNQYYNNDPVLIQLRQLLTSLEAGGQAIFPHSNELLLKSVVEAAAKIFHAAAASILLVNEKENVLEFKVAYGEANRDLVGMQIPLTKGIAGYVVMTGQPLAISDVQQDARFNQDFAKSTGYVPHSILATPLLVEERVIGVMEVLDKIDAPSFGMKDMELLAIFANQAAIAINQAQNFDLVNGALMIGLRRLLQDEKLDELDELLKNLDKTAEVHSAVDLLAIADKFNAISSLGEAERKTCLQILNIFAEYQHSLHRKWS